MRSRAPICASTVAPVSVASLAPPNSDVDTNEPTSWRASAPSGSRPQSSRERAPADPRSSASHAMRPAPARGPVNRRRRPPARAKRVAPGSRAACRSDPRACRTRSRRSARRSPRGRPSLRGRRRSPSATSRRHRLHRCPSRRSHSRRPLRSRQHRRRTRPRLCAADACPSAPPASFCSLVDWSPSVPPLLEPRFTASVGRIRPARVVRRVGSIGAAVDPVSAELPVDPALSVPSVEPAPSEPPVDPVSAEPSVEPVPSEPSVEPPPPSEPSSLPSHRNYQSSRFHRNRPSTPSRQSHRSNWFHLNRPSNPSRRMFRPTASRRHRSPRARPSRAPSTSGRGWVPAEPSSRLLSTPPRSGLSARLVMKPESSPDVPLEPDAALPAAAADEAVVSPDACPSVAPSKMPLAGESDARGWATPLLREPVRRSHRRAR